MKNGAAYTFLRNLQLDSNRVWQVILFSTILSIPAWSNDQPAVEQLNFQVYFPTSIFDRKDNILSELLFQLPSQFPQFKLNTIGRGIHASLIYLDETNLNELRKIAKLFSQMDRTLLKEYNLDGTYSVLDTENIEIITVGHSQMRFLALRPHREFIEWRTRFFKLLADRAPQLLEKHKAHRNLGDRALDPDGFHISILQYEVGGHSYPITESEAEIAKTKLKTLIQSTIAQYKQAHGGQSPKVEFSLTQNPMIVAEAPRSLALSSETVLGYKQSPGGTPVINPIIRWSMNRPGEDPEIHNRTPIEIKTSDLLDGKIKFSIPNLSSSLNISQYQETPPVQIEELKKLLSPKLRQALEVEIERGNLPPSKMPSLVSTFDPTQNHFFVTSAYHPLLNPRKSFSILSTAEKIRLHSTEEVSSGLALYASSVREDILNPGDYDLLINSLVYVPDQISTQEEIDQYVAHQFAKVVFGQLFEQVKNGQIAITEMRIGSDATLGVPYENPIKALESNPYFSQADLLSNQLPYKGHVFTLEEAILSKDFIKGKVDLKLADGSRAELSLQFLIGYHHRGNNYFFQNEGLKGVGTLMRTAVYDGPESFAIATALARPQEFYRIQRGGLYPYAIRDLVQAAFPDWVTGTNTLTPLETSPIWNSKFLKKFYNFIVLMSRSGNHLEAKLFDEVVQFLKQNGMEIDSNFQLEPLIERLKKSFNHPYLKLVNALKRNVNDLSEYNERKVMFTHDQWQNRIVEIKHSLAEINLLIVNQSIQSSPQFTEALNNFTHLIELAEHESTPEKASLFIIRDEHYDTLVNFEHKLAILEGKIVTKYEPTLTPQDLMLIQTTAAVLPHFYIKYLQDYSVEPDYKIKLTLQLLGINPTPLNVTRMKSASRIWIKLSKSALISQQKDLYNKPGRFSDCSSVLQSQ